MNKKLLFFLSALLVSIVSITKSSASISSKSISEEEGGICRCHSNEQMCLTGHAISFRARCECSIMFGCIDEFEETAS